MGNRYFMSDLHDGHRAIGKYRSQVDPSVTGIEENREWLRKHWRAKKRDIVYMLGDVAMGEDSIEFLKSLEGRKILILGNHDLERSSSPKLKDLETVFEKVHGVMKTNIPSLKSKAWLQHTPIHPQELRGIYMIHGHIHDHNQDFMNITSKHYNEKFINVNVDALFSRTGSIMVDDNEIVDYVNGVWLP